MAHTSTAEAITMVKDFFNEAKSSRDKVTDRWRKNEALYYGRHWEHSNLMAHQSKMSFNYPLSLVETTLPIIADYMPIIDVLPREPNDIPFADMLQFRKKQLEDESKLYDNILSAIKDSLVYSNGLLEILPKLDKDQNFYGIDVKVIDPFTFFPDPYATDLDLKGNCKYVVFATPMAVDKIKEQYGVDVQTHGELDDFRAFQYSDPVNFPDNDTKDKNNKKTAMSLVLECFWNCEGYPNGRFTAICGDTLLTDEPLELSRIPYFMIGNYKSPHSIWGIGEPELIRTQTKVINEVMSSVADNIKRTGNPSRKISTRALARQKKKLTGAVGEQYVVDDPNDVTWEQPPSIPAYVQHFVNQVQNMQDSVSGVHDVTQGRNPSGVTAGKAIIALQEAGQTRIRYKIAKEISKLITEVGEYMVDMLQTYDDKVVNVRTTNEFGEMDFKEYNPNMLIDKNGRQEGEVGFSYSSAKSLRDTTFDIEVNAGFRPPNGRQATEERAMQLFQLGVYGIEDVVKSLNEPNKQEIIERFYQRQQEQQQQQMNAENQQLGQKMDVPPEIVESVRALMQQGIEPNSPEEQQLQILMEKYPQLQNLVQ